jgi:hypothetical protein
VAVGLDHNGSSVSLIGELLLGSRERPRHPLAQREALHEAAHLGTGSASQSIGSVS